MKIKHVILIWVSLILIDSLLAVDGDPIWDSIYFAKDYIFPVFLLYRLREYVIDKQEKALCVVGMSIYLIKSITEIGFILSIINTNSSVHTLIYTAFLLIVLATFGYDRKEQR